MRKKLILALILLSVIFQNCKKNSNPPPPQLKPALVKTGGVQVIMADNYLGLQYFPDETLTVIRGNSTNAYRALAAAAISTYLIQGPSDTNITSAALALTKGAAGSYDNGYAGISGAYYHTDNKLYAIYHGEDQEGMPPVGGGIPGFYCSVCLAVSTDNGASFSKSGPIITSQKPKSWDAYPGQADKGAGEPYCAASRDGKYLYAYYTEHSRVNNRGVQICMARCDVSTGAPLPGRWYKYYNGAFSEAGIGGLDTPVMSADFMDNSEALEPFVDYSPYLGRYVMIFGIDHYKEWLNITSPVPDKCGIYTAYSEDGITWGKPDQQVIKDFSVPITGMSLSWHGMVIWDDAQKREGLMIWSYSERWGHTADGNVPHYMVGQRVRFDLQ